MPKPLLLIDIDGVISLYGFDPRRPPPGHFRLVDGIAHFLSAAAGEQLGRLAGAYELAWCSGWEEKANEHLPLALALPGPLPHLRFGRPADGAAAHWKLAAIDAFAGPTRPLAWIDDAHIAATAEWAAARAAPTLLVGTEPPTGMTEKHVVALLAWAAEMGAGARSALEPEALREGGGGLSGRRVGAGGRDAPPGRAA